MAQTVARWAHNPEVPGSSPGPATPVARSPSGHHPLQDGGRYAVSMHPAVILFVYALAVARVTRLINEDVLLDGPRERLVSWAWARRYGRTETFARAEDGTPLGRMPYWQVARRLDAAEPKLAYLITCPWCASIYVGAVAAPLAYWLGSSPWLFVPALALAFSYVTGFMAAQQGE